MTVRALLMSVCFAAVTTSALHAQPQDQDRDQRPSTAVTPQAPRPGAAPAAPQPTPAAAPVPQPTPQRSEREGQPVNIRVDLTITDQRGGNPVFKKTITVVTADGLGGFIRSTARYQSIGDVPLNVDAQPRLLPDGKIRVSVNLQYDLPVSLDPSETRNEERRAGPLTKTSIHENLSLILESGKSIVAAQSADPVGDRQVMIEVKATILR